MIDMCLMELWFAWYAVLMYDYMWYVTSSPIDDIICLDAGLARQGVDTRVITHTYIHHGVIRHHTMTEATKQLRNMTWMHAENWHEYETCMNAIDSHLNGHDRMVIRN